MKTGCFIATTLLLLGSAVPGAPGLPNGGLWLDQSGAPINAHGAGMLHHAGRYYWFGEHKVAGELGNTAQVGVRVYSSEDLMAWRDEGVALAVSADPASEIHRGCIIERPKVIHNAATGKFVMWFHLEPEGRGYLGARSGVAVADAVAGPYRFLGSLRPNAGVWPIHASAEHKTPLNADQEAFIRSLDLRGGPKEGYPKDLIFRRDFAGGQMARDMTLFVDDDGAAYHIFASEENGTLHISQLSDDYLRPAGRYARAFPGGFHEAPSLFKHVGRYWMITSGCTGWAPNAARLSVAESIWGPWTELGNPWVGPAEQTAISFDSQSTFVLPVVGKPGAFIFMADRWRPANAIDGRYVWVPVLFREDGQPYLKWHDTWDVSAMVSPPATPAP